MGEIKLKCYKKKRPRRKKQNFNINANHFKCRHFSSQHSLSCLPIRDRMSVSRKNLRVSFCRVFKLIKRGISDDDGKEKSQLSVPHTTQYII